MNIVLAETNTKPAGQADTGKSDTSKDTQFGDLMNQRLHDGKQPEKIDKNPQVVENKAIKSDPQGEDVSQKLSSEWSPELTGDLVMENIEPNAELLSSGGIAANSELAAEFYGVPVDVIIDEAGQGDDLPLAGNPLPPVSAPVYILPNQDMGSRNKISAVVNPTGSIPIPADSAQATDDALISQVLRQTPTTEPAILNKGENLVEKLQAGGISDFQLTNSMVNNGSETSSHLFRFPGQVANTTLNQTLPPQLETMTLSSPRDQVALSSGLGERIHWMVNQKLNSATIRMDPPSLGRLEVHIQVVDDATNVTINTQHAQTRDLIDNASMRLKEYLQENGYENVNVDVSQEQQQQAADQQQDSFQRSEDSSAASTAETILVDSSSRFISSESVVDYFA